MKRTTFISLCLLLALFLSACGGTCKVPDCGISSYKQGYCEVHYAIHAGAAALGELFG